MPREGLPTGGQPTLEVRLNVRLYVAERHCVTSAKGTQATGHTRLDSDNFNSIERKTTVPKPPAIRPVLFGRACLLVEAHQLDQASRSSSALMGTNGREALA